MNEEYSKNLAAIDIGSNAARLLIKNVYNDPQRGFEMSKLFFLRVPLRLGMDVYETGNISSKKLESFIYTMQAFKKLMDAFDVADYRAVATSAVRDAENGKEILADVQQESMLKIDLISGEEECRLTYNNSCTLTKLPGAYLFVDVGGGSTEITFINNKKRIFAISYPIGTIRILKKVVDVEVIQKLEKDLRFISKQQMGVSIIGSGGNINKIYKMLSKLRKDNGILPVELLDDFYQKTKKMTFMERMEKYGLKPDRADVIVPAAEIFLKIAAATNAKKILVPSLGLADGLMNDLVANNISNSES